MTTAPQILHFEQGPCNRFECMLYYWQKERRRASSVRCAVPVKIGSDHTFDHLQVRTTWTQCSKEHPKAVISDTKALKITRNPLFYKAFTVRDVEVASSNLVTSTSRQCRQPMSLFALPNSFVQNPMAKSAMNTRTIKTKKRGVTSLFCLVVVF